jgi:P27 family predicted phage terminase small subunit
MVGRRPKPTALKLLDGNPGHRAMNNSEPLFTGIPTCPKHLDKVAKAEWKRVAGELAATGLLTTVDRAALAAYCSAWSRWVTAEEAIQKFGMVIKSPKSGFPIQNPYVGVANTALDHLRKFASEFGMTPSSRSRINVSSTPSAGDPFADFMAHLGAEEIDMTLDADSSPKVLLNTSK